MKLLGLLICLAGSTFAAASGAHPCEAYPGKVITLLSCSSRSAFCTRYLGGPATFTRTASTTITVPHSTTTTTSVSTSIVTVYTATVEAFAPTVTIGTVSTITTLDSTCQTAGAKLARAAAPRSCGLSNVAPAAISAACECVLASSTVVTSTSTRGGTQTKTVTAHSTTTQTVNAVSTTTITPSTTVATSTASNTACATACPTFAIRALTGPNTPNYAILQRAYSGQFLNLDVGTVQEAAVFSIDPSTGQLITGSDPDVLSFVPEGDAQVYGIARFLPADQLGTADVPSCVFVGPELQCSYGSYTTWFSYPDALYVSQPTEMWLPNTLGGQCVNS